jgi:hypothetical protein
VPSLLVALDLSSLANMISPEIFPARAGKLTEQNRRNEVKKINFFIFQFPDSDR